ncbi:hypothetical protein TRFO_22729 [Tritrichomonas foetus]|uniref:Uncharacterized protein n=1 Tax=Tritrichomonas foetus TaxID=1144522 RepID=A0A1J4KCI4_9EUKA|nr:hypothetical protein TRFO_22729 [Tritrichomonas foetus]|eukprot:OHT08648.1 hypothetical protein TRFO_22729 [Tritrichomonas foetus]
MPGENNILLFGEFCSVTDETNSSSGLELHWETEDKTTIQDIASSSQVIVIVLNDGTSYSFGFNTFGQLGIGSNSFCQKFTKVSSNTSFISVSCGSNFTLWRSVNNELFVAGESFTTTPQRFSSTKVISMSAYETTFAIIDDSGMVKLWPTFSQSHQPFCCCLPSQPSEISCGKDFASVLCNGSVFRINKSGIFEPLVTIGQYSDGTPSATCIRSSADYTIVLDRSQNVWLYGNVGNLSRKISTTPIAKEIRSIYAMPNFCAFVNNLGITYTFGENGSGQLADGTRLKRTRIVETTVSRPVIFIVGGKTFSVFVSIQFDPSLFQINMEEFVPGHMSCPFEKAEDMIDGQTSP